MSTFLHCNLTKLVYKAISDCLITTGESLSSACVPALLVKESTVLTAPWERTSTDLHVLRLRTLTGMGMLSKEDVLKGRNETDWETNHEGDLDPLPHLVNLFVVSVSVGTSLQFLLVSQSGTDLLHSIRLHSFLATSSRYSSGRSALSHLHGRANSKTTSSKLQYSKITNFVSVNTEFHNQAIRKGILVRVFTLLFFSSQ